MWDVAKHKVYKQGYPRLVQEWLNTGCEPSAILVEKSTPQEQNQIEHLPTSVNTAAVKEHAVFTVIQYNE